MTQAHTNSQSKSNLAMTLSEPRRRGANYAVRSNRIAIEEDGLN